MGHALSFVAVSIHFQDMDLIVRTRQARIEKIIQDALDYASAIGDLWCIGFCNLVLLDFFRNEGAFEQAEQCGRKAVLVYESLHNRSELWEVFVRLEPVMNFKLAI